MDTYYEETPTAQNLQIFVDPLKSGWLVSKEITSLRALLIPSNTKKPKLYKNDQWSKKLVILLRQVEFASAFIQSLHGGSR